MASAEYTEAVKRIATHHCLAKEDGAEVRKPLAYQSFHDDAAYFERHMRMDGPVGSVIVNRDGTELSDEQRRIMLDKMDEALAVAIADGLEPDFDVVPKEFSVQMRDERLSDYLPGIKARDAILHRNELPELGGVQSPVFDLPRDFRLGNDGEFVADTVPVVIVEPGRIPLVDTLQIVGGSYGPTPQIGPYTIMPGKYMEARGHESWNGMIFLATPEQVRKAIEEASELIQQTGAKRREGLVGDEIEKVMIPFSEETRVWREMLKTAHAGLDYYDTIQTLSELEETKPLVDCFLQLPAALRAGHYKGLKAAAEKYDAADPVPFIEQVQAVGFEIERTVDMAKLNGDFVVGADHTGIVRRGSGSIQNDVPVAYQGKMFIYEVKSFPFRPYGSLPGNGEQAQKYQHAIEAGEVSGGAVEIQGCIDPSLIQAIHQEGKYPDLQIVYHMTLPSGDRYRVALKDGRVNLPVNDIEDLADPADRAVALGLAIAIAESKHGQPERLNALLSGQFTPSAELQAWIQSEAAGFEVQDGEAFGPGDIRNLDTYRLYLAERLQAQHAMLTELSQRQPGPEVMAGTLQALSLGAGVHPSGGRT